MRDSGTIGEALASSTNGLNSRTRFLGSRGSPQNGRLSAAILIMLLTRLRPGLVQCRMFSSAFKGGAVPPTEGAAEAFPLKAVYQTEMLRKASWYDDEMKEWSQQ